MASQNNKQATFIIFSSEGFEQAKSDMQEMKAIAWVNPKLLYELSSSLLDELNIEIHQLPQNYDASNEKSVMSAISHVETKSKQPIDIFVEYM